MAKANRIFATVALLIALCLALVGCGGNIQTSDNDQNFVGTWQLVSATQDGVTYGQSEINALSLVGQKIELTVKNDKTFKFEYVGQSVEGTWEAKSDKAAKVTVAGVETEASIDDSGQLSISHDDISVNFKKSS